MLCRTPREARRSRKAAAAYWTPRSLWKISPGAGRSRRTAMFRASRVSWVSMRWEKAYPRPNGVLTVHIAPLSFALCFLQPVDFLGALWAILGPVAPRLEALAALGA